MSNERTAFKAKFRKHFDVSEILSLDKFTDKITEHMWLGYQAGAEWQRSQSAPAGYVMVPVEPNEAMLDAMWNNVQQEPEDSQLKVLYRAILAAAPKADVQEPVASLHTHFDGRKRVQFPGGVYDQDAGWGAHVEPLYAAPQPVSDDARDALIVALRYCLEIEDRPMIIKLAKDAINAAMGVSDE